MPKNPEIVAAVLNHFNIPVDKHQDHIAADTRRGRGGGSLNKSALRTYRVIYATLNRAEREAVRG